MNDFSIENHGSIVLLRPQTEDARQWIEDNVQITDETQFWGRALVVEPRYVDELVFGIVDSDLTVGGPF